MNTPAHVVVNLTILGRKEQPGLILAVVVGALLPDLPMFVFYCYAKVFRRIPEGLIWSQAFFQPEWQLFFDIFNSLPLMALGFLAAHHFGFRRLAACFASMILHSLGDFALHHHDAHRHLFPFSEWRFRSPISYWDPQHFGQIVGLLEALVVISGSYILIRRFTSIRARSLVMCLIVAYTVYWGYALVVWA